MAIHLRDDQRSALSWARKTLLREGGVLFADAPGYGKSYQALGLSQLLSLRPIIIAPRGLVSMWKNYLSSVEMDGEVFSYGSIDRLHARWLENGVEEACVLIVDEAHAFVNPSTQRYAALARVCLGVPVILLSATPFQNRSEDGLHVLALFSGEAAWFLRQPNEKAAGLRSLMQRVSVARQPPTQRSIDRRRFDVYAEREAIQVATEAICLQGEPEGLIRHWLLGRRLSSYSAWLASITKAARYVEEQQAALADGRTLTRSVFARDFAHGQRAFPFMLAPAAHETLTKERLEHSLTTLRDAATLVQRRRDPTPWRWIRTLKRPVLIFTRYHATAHEIYRHLRAELRMIRWTGAGIQSNFPRTDAPLNTQLSNAVLVATDVAAEGIDLRVCETLVHADMHWNPMRTIQREGRIRRGAGSTRATVWQPRYPDNIGDLWSIETRRAYKESLPSTFAPMVANASNFERDTAANVDASHALYWQAYVQALRDASSLRISARSPSGLAWFELMESKHLLPAAASAWIALWRTGGAQARTRARQRLNAMHQRILTQFRTPHGRETVLR